MYKTNPKLNYRSFFNWSGGKDCSLALFYALQNSKFSIERLVTNLDMQFRRVSMHGVREEMIELQAASIGIPLQKLFLSEQPSMLDYEKATTHLLEVLQQDGFSHAFYGDIFLEDLRIYREKQLAKASILAEFPLWQKNTLQLINTFIDLGFKAVVVCVNADLLDQSFAGRIIDKQFFKDLPSGVDPCGENGEFHTFVFDGPIFKQSISYSIGEKVYKEYVAPKESKDECFRTQQVSSNMGFWFCDLVPNSDII